MPGATFASIVGVHWETVSIARVLVAQSVTTVNQGPWRSDDIMMKPERTQSAWMQNDNLSTYLCADKAGSHNLSRVISQVILMHITSFFNVNIDVDIDVELRPLTSSTWAGISRHVYMCIRVCLHKVCTCTSLIAKGRRKPEFPL